MSTRTTLGGKNIGRPTNVRPGSGPSSGRFNDRRTTMIPQNQRGLKWTKEDDVRLLQDLEVLGEEGKLSLQELDKPQDSRRIFSANGVVPALISTASLVPVDELYNRLMSEASNFIPDMRLHPKFGATTGLAACIKAYIALFDPTSPAGNVNVSDILYPTSYRVRQLLNELIAIVRVTSLHETTLTNYFHTLKEQKDRESDLWNMKLQLETMERDHEAKVDREKTEIDRLKDISGQKEEEERVWTAKVAEMHDLAEKAMEKRRLYEQKVANGKNDTALLKNKLENMQAQVVVDPETAIKKLKEIEEEKAFKDAERVKAYDKYKSLAQWDSQNLLKDMDDTLEMFANAQKKDHKELLTLEKELRSIESDLARSRDDLAIKEKDFKRAMDNLKELEERKINMKDDVAQKKKRQQQRIKELEKEMKATEKEVEKIRVNTEKLRIATAKKEEEVTALKLQRQKWMRDYFAVLADHSEACQAATAEVMAKKVQCDERVFAQREWHRKTFGYEIDNPPQPDENGKISLSKVLPVNVVPIYKGIHEMERSRKHGRWVVPSNVQAIITTMDNGSSSTEQTGTVGSNNVPEPLSEASPAKIPESFEDLAINDN